MSCEAAPSGRADGAAAAAAAVAAAAAAACEFAGLKLRPRPPACGPAAWLLASLLDLRGRRGSGGGDPDVAPPPGSGMLRSDSGTSSALNDDLRRRRVFVAAYPVDAIRVDLSHGMTTTGAAGASDELRRRRAAPAA